MFYWAVVNNNTVLVTACCSMSSQVLQMYLPFCGIAISNAQLFAASRKEYDRSRVRALRQP